MALADTIPPPAEAAAHYYVQGTTWLMWTEEGVASRTLTRSLARNALVRSYKVRVTATRADQTRLDSAGQVRKQADYVVGGATVGVTLVVDFGMLRTVNGIGQTPDHAVDLEIVSLKAFRGDQFGSTIYYDPLPDSAAAPLTFEQRTERVRIEVKPVADIDEIAQSLWLRFPDLPTDLEIRIDGGAPVWSAPGVAQPGSRGWDGNAERIVDLTAALAALTGDPHDDTGFDANIVLTSRIPGVLTIDDESADVAYLTRSTFAGTEETALTLEEGEYDVTLGLPDEVLGVQEVWLKLTGTVPPERILPAVGPPPALVPGGAGAAYQLQLDPEHAGAVRLIDAGGFGELVAVRLPLRAAATGAEVRVVLHEGTADGPVRPVSGGTSTPVELAPAVADAAEGWTSFALPKPVKLDPALLYWAAVTVSRGEASWALGRAAAEGEAAAILRGAPSGPWHQLPTVALADAAVTGRVRLVGKPRPDDPTAPLSLAVIGAPVDAGSPIDATPTPKGAGVKWVAQGAVVAGGRPAIGPIGGDAGKSIKLHLTSFMVGKVKLSDIDVVYTQ